MALLFVFTWLIGVGDCQIAHRLKGYKEIRVTLREGTRQDALDKPAGVRNNRVHELYRKN